MVCVFGMLFLWKTRYRSVSLSRYGKGGNV